MTICFFFAVKYSISAPDSVKDTANTFKRKLKNKTKIKLKNAEKKNKPSDIVLVFFPVVSRTGTDIDAAVNSIKGKKWLRENIAWHS